MNAQWRCTLVIVVISLVGCGGGSAKNSVTGQVTFKDQPLKTGMVTFIFADGPRSSAIGPNGMYWIENLPVGQTAKIEVASQVRSPFSEKKFPKGAPKTEGRDSPVISIPPKYQDATKSGLSWTVRPGEQTHNIELLP